MNKLIAACGLWLFATAAIASDSVSLSIGKWLFKDIQADNAQFDLTLTPTGLSLIASADSVQLPAPVGQLKQITLTCKRLVIQAQHFSCPKGQFGFTHADLGKQNVDFELSAKPDNNQYHLIVSDLTIADASFNIDFDWQDQSRWHAIIASPQVQIKKVLTIALPYLSDEPQTLADWDSDGTISLHTDLVGHADVIEKAQLDITSTSLNVSDNAGRYVSEQLAVTMQAKLEQQHKNWQWQTQLTVNGGQAYAEPIFIDASTTPFSFSGQGQWRQQDKLVTVSHFEFNQPNVVQLSGALTADDTNITQADITLNKTALSSLYKTWLQPFMTGTAVDNLQLAGQVQMHYQHTADTYQLLVGLDDVYIDDQAQRFGIDGLSGNLAWTNSDKVMTTDLSWHSAYVYSIAMGGSSLLAEVDSSTLSLTETWHLPILDGELQLNQLQLHYPDGEHATWSFDGLLTPISMESLSAALDWPLLHGKLSGVIPRVSYVDQKIEVNGALMVKLFEGTTVIRDLRLNKPFGALPQLYANIDLVGLDLETLTRTFDFGKITGKLDGTVKNLRLSNWQPVQFEAQFATPEGDKSRRKISQRAVDNLSQIGGGASGILSRSFLRFFEDFSYKGLGLSCQLLNNVCQMSGVGESENGYYIVKGGGLPPRINVVGYTRRVDWSDLIERLKAVQNSSGPVIQ
ncbi:MAG: hypothetical protein IBX57_07595 [Gammaproteobacteria bacterium]|nr:hypothetical protein [Gammaproteobacteria bacterium]